MSSGREATMEDPLPKDAVGFSGKYSKLKMPLEEEIEIFIVHIVNPGLFHYQLYRYKDELGELMDEIK